MKLCRQHRTAKALPSVILLFWSFWILLDSRIVALSARVGRITRRHGDRHSVSRIALHSCSVTEQEAFIASKGGSHQKDGRTERFRNLAAYDDYDHPQEERWDFMRTPGYKRGSASRGDRRRAGKWLRQHELSNNDDPIFSEDFGGIPNLPHKTPIALPGDKLEEEFLEMRKRQIPHSVLKDHYMHRFDPQEEVVGFDGEFQPIMETSERDNSIYLFGEGILPREEESFKECEGYEEVYGEKAAEGRSLDGTEDGYEDPERKRRMTREEYEDLVNKTRELSKCYNGKDRVCQMLLSALKEYQEINMDSEDPEDEPPEGNDVMISEMDDYFILDSDDVLPIWYHKWNKEYLRGRAGLKGAELEKYDMMWHDRLDWLTNRYRSLFSKESILDKLIVDFNRFYGHLKQRKQSKMGVTPSAGKVPIGDYDTRSTWTEYVSPAVFENMVKHSLARDKVNGKGAAYLDLKADAFKSCVDMSLNRLLRERAMKEAEKERLDYIAFLRKRRHVLKTGNIGPQRNTPYWLWEECWRRRETSYPDTLLEILKAIHAVDPNIDLRKLTKGTLEQIKSPKLAGTKFDVRRAMDDSLSSLLGPVEEFLEKTDAERKQREEAMAGASGSKEAPLEDEKTTTELTDGLGTISIPKPLGYYFKDVLSFDEFEKQFKKSNMEAFGTEEYGVRVGQLVKGTVEIIRPKYMLVDIHTSKFATIKLNDHFETAGSVPSGGFTALFKRGDELYFEVLSKYGNNIRLSTRRIQTMYKSRDIYRKYFKQEVIRVRVLQRYTHGVLVQYQGDKVVDIPNYRCPTDVSSLENLAFVPYGQLDKQYRSLLHHIRRDIVGKIIPVYISDFAVCNGIPLVSNIEALRRLLLAHIKPGDRIMASACMYGKHALWLHLGHTIGILPVTEMSKTDYEKHIQGDVKVRTAIVTDVDYETGTMELSSKLLDDENLNRPFNECFRRLKADPDVIETYNALIKEAGPPTSELRSQEPTDSEMKNLHEIHKVPNIRLTNSITPNLPEGIEKPMESTFTGTHWDVNSPDFPDNVVTDEHHAYNNYMWHVMTEEENWEPLSAAEMRVLNRARYQNDEVVYYQHEGRNYRADLIDMVRQNLTDHVEQPLRNNYYSVDNEDFIYINSLLTTETEPEQ